MTITTEHLTVEYKDLERILLPKLKGHVFHATSHEVANKILSGESILPNLSGKRSGVFGNYTNSYFRGKNCVSLFDLRTATPEEVTDCFIMRVSGLNPMTANGQTCYLFLESSYHHNLISWQAWLTDKAYHTMIVPYVECGYPSSIESKAITHMIFVSTPPRSPSHLESLHIG